MLALLLIVLKLFIDNNVIIIDAASTIGKEFIRMTRFADPPLCGRNGLAPQAVKLKWHFLYHFIRHKIGYKMASKDLANVEYSSKYGQKTTQKHKLIKLTVFWPYLDEYLTLAEFFDIIL